MIVNVALDQEPIKFEAGETKQLAGLVMRKLPSAVAFDREPFERLAARIAVLDDVVRQLNRDLHEFKVNAICLLGEANDDITYNMISLEM